MNNFDNEKSEPIPPPRPKSMKEHRKVKPVLIVPPPKPKLPEKIKGKSLPFPKRPPSDNPVFVPASNSTKSIVLKSKPTPPQKPPSPLRNKLTVSQQLNQSRPIPKPRIVSKPVPAPRKPSLTTASLKVFNVDIASDCNGEKEAKYNRNTENIRDIDVEKLPNKEERSSNGNEENENVNSILETVVCETLLENKFPISSVSIKKEDIQTNSDSEQKLVDFTEIDSGKNKNLTLCIRRTKSLDSEFVDDETDIYSERSNSRDSSGSVPQYENVTLVDDNNEQSATLRCSSMSSPQSPKQESDCFGYKKTPALVPFMGLRSNLRHGFHNRPTKQNSYEQMMPVHCNMDEESLYSSPPVHPTLENRFLLPSIESHELISSSKNSYDLYSSPKSITSITAIENNDSNVSSFYISPNISSAEGVSNNTPDYIQAYDYPRKAEEVSIQKVTEDVDEIINETVTNMPLYNIPSNKGTKRVVYEDIDLKLKESAGTDCSHTSQCKETVLPPKPLELPPRPPPPRRSFVEPETCKGEEKPKINTSKTGVTDDFDTSESESDESSHSQSSIKTKKSKLFSIVEEILTTERTFVNALKLICEVFLGSVDEAISRNNKLLPDGAYSVMFMNVKQIYDLDLKFLLELERRMENWQFHNRLGDIVREYGHFLKIYEVYIKGYDSSLSMFHECLATNSKFTQLVKSFEEEDNRMRLSTYMLKPIQRIPSYRLLLKEYLKNLPQDNIDYKDISDGIEIVSEVANHINESMKEGEKFHEVLRVQALMVNVKDIVKPGRYLIKEGVLGKMSRKEMQQRTFILFTDVLFYCSSLHNQLKLILELPLVGMIVQYPESKDMTNEFSVISTKRSFMLRASSVEERDAWVKALQNAVTIAMEKKVTFGLTKDLKTTTRNLGDAAPPWIPDSRVTMCQICAQVFTVYKRRHHCRACGMVVCQACSVFEAPLKFMEYEPARVCESCYHQLKERESKHNHENREAILAKFRILKGKRNRKDRRKTLPSTLTEVAAQDVGIENSGFLRQLKKGKKEKRCWFVLKDHVLYIYKASSDPAAITTLPVLGYDIDASSNWDNGDFTFTLSHTGVKEPLVFKAENRTAGDRWLHCLRNATGISTLS